MIDKAVLLLKNELESYINFKDASVNVVIDNIGLFETSKGDTLTNNIVISNNNLIGDWFIHEIQMKKSTRYKLRISMNITRGRRIINLISNIIKIMFTFQ